MREIWVYRLAQTFIPENNVCIEARNRANRVLGFIARSIKSRSGEVILKLYLALVRHYSYKIWYIWRLLFYSSKWGCANNQCENGRCRPNRRDTEGGYRCRCKKGWSGKFCNEGKKNFIYLYCYFAFCSEFWFSIKTPIYLIFPKQFLWHWCLNY